MYSQWKAPDNFKIDFFVIRVGEWGAARPSLALTSARLIEW
jgi:hypothetical protein